MFATSGAPDRTADRKFRGAASFICRDRPRLVHLPRIVPTDRDLRRAPWAGPIQPSDREMGQGIDSRQIVDHLLPRFGVVPAEVDLACRGPTVDAARFFAVDGNRLPQDAEVRMFGKTPVALRP